MALWQRCVNRRQAAEQRAAETAQRLAIERQVAAEHLELKRAELVRIDRRDAEAKQAAADQAKRDADQDDRIKKNEDRERRFQKITLLVACVALVVSAVTASVNYRATQSALQAAQANVFIAQRSGAWPVIDIARIPLESDFAGPEGFVNPEGTIDNSQIAVAIHNEGRGETDVTAIQLAVVYQFEDYGCFAFRNPDVFVDSPVPAVLPPGRRTEFILNTFVAQEGDDCAGFSSEVTAYFGNGCTVKFTEDEAHNRKSTTQCPTQDSDSLPA